ncbi:aldo/keto reductase [Maribacter antarcticus]|uniref:aldo/keto reductase n=1 Tax=Maribacter antarcticus TaxID=505250 RepID=UPI000688EA41|nr:aldo/keto reductase [Maribacter antarcticus]
MLLNSKIGIGTVQFGLDYGISNNQGKTLVHEVSKILEFAINNNVNYLDTAYAYGTAEEVIGNFNLDKFKIISKYVSNSKNTLEEQIATSLTRLNQKSVYGYLAHRPLDLIDNNKENWKKLQQQKASGTITKIGASFNTIAEIEKVLDSGIQLDIIQVPYNYLDSRFENYMKILSKQGCEIHTRSTFLQGLFFCNIDKLDSFFNTVKPILKEIQKFENLSGCLLQYVLEKEYVSVANIGVNNLEQLKNNLLLIGKENNRLLNTDFKIKSEILMPSNWPKKINND